MHLRYALKSGSRADHDLAVRYLGESRAAWRRLTLAADEVYAPIADVRAGQRGFQWSSREEPLEQLDATVEKLWDRRAVASAKPLAILATDRRDDLGINAHDLKHAADPDGTAVTISCKPMAKKYVVDVRLWYKPMPSEAKWACVPMEPRPPEVKPPEPKPEGGKVEIKAEDKLERYVATVPLTSEGLLYFVEIEDDRGVAANCPLALQDTPYKVIDPKPPK
jgi:hypothetical protein